MSNAVKTALEEAFEARVAAIKQAQLASTLAQQHIDVTLPGVPVSLGHVHPSTQTLREIAAIFADMGFQIFDSREVESDLYNFELLNMPPYHPARDMWDTFYINERVVLRTHTSPGQIRAMQMYHPEPIRVILPGMCYRYEAITARSRNHVPSGRGAGCGDEHYHGGPERRAGQLCPPHVRRRPPGAFSLQPFPLYRAECRSRYGLHGLRQPGLYASASTAAGWRFSAPAWCIPQVLRNGGYDPEVFSGFAFGMGPERITMLKYGIDDIRYFFSNDLRFLEQFG